MENGEISTDPGTIRNIVTAFWGGLLAVTPETKHADEGEWRQYDQEKPELIVSEVFTAAHIQEYLTETPLNKAPDLHGINATVLWYSPPRLHELVARIFCAIMELEHLPTCWNTTWTSLLYKSGPTAVVSNYRPISIVNFFVKMIDGIIFQRSAPLLEGSQRLHRMQWAGRPNTGCQEALGLMNACLDYSNRNEARGDYEVAGNFPGEPST
jgi:hypothetical protein